MLFAWLRRRRRERTLAAPYPPAWRATFRALPHVGVLPSSEAERLFAVARVFIAEKTWEGCGGVELTDDMQVAIAGFACLLTLGMPEPYFDNVSTILVYPAAFAVPEKVALGADAVLEGESVHLGEAHHRGPVVLSWADIQEDMTNPFGGVNLVFHEFAHQLDMTNGAFDGVPRLPRPLRQPWADVMEKEYKKLQKKARRGRHSVIDPYGAENPAEFFAVITEAFFDAPLDLRSTHGELYELLRRYYAVDPAAWHEQAGMVSNSQG